MKISRIGVNILTVKPRSLIFLILFLLPFPLMGQYKLITMSIGGSSGLAIVSDPRFSGGKIQGDFRYFGGFLIHPTRNFGIRILGEGLFRSKSSYSLGYYFRSFYGGSLKGYLEFLLYPPSGSTILPAPSQSLSFGILAGGSGTFARYDLTDQYFFYPSIIAGPLMDYHLTAGESFPFFLRGVLPLSWDFRRDTDFNLNIGLEFSINMGF